jgi:hypothetical protein
VSRAGSDTARATAVRSSPTQQSVSRKSRRFTTTSFRASKGITGYGPRGRARRLDGVRRVDVRAPGHAPEDDRLGDQILVFEVLRAPQSSLSRWSPISSSEAIVDGWVGHVPEFGWGEDLAMRQRRSGDWTLDVKAWVVGLPLSGRVGLADSVAERFELERCVAELQDGSEGVAPFPPELVAASTDLGTSADALRAMRIEDPPVYAGRRHLRKGEALWRYEGPDAVDRLEAAIAQLQGAGSWEDAGPRSRGVDGRAHLVSLRRGDEYLRFQYHENRVARFQQVSYVSQSTPDGGSTPWTKGVEGEPLDPVVWLYYRHEASAEELLELHARAKALGADVLAAFEANLPRSRRVELGLVDVEASAD